MANSFSQQFKTILWKNWKIFNKKTSFFFCVFELFYTFLIVTVLCKFKYIYKYKSEFLKIIIKK